MKSKGKKPPAGRLLILLAAFLALLLAAAPAFAGEESGGGSGGEDGREDVETELERLLGETDLSSWQEYFDRMREALPDTGESTPAELAGKLAETVSGGADGLLTGEYLASALLPGLREALFKMAGVFGAALLTGLCGIAFDDAGLKKLVLLFICGAAILSVTAAFSALAAEASGMITDTAGFASAAAPALGALLASMGFSESARLLTPRLAFAAGGASALIEGAVMPMLLASGVMTVLNGLTDGLKLERWIRLLHKTAKWLLGLLTAVYTASAAVCGVGASYADGVRLRTAKYAVDKLIPAVGGMVTGAADAVRSAALLLKNGAGTAALIILFGVLLRPALALFCGMLAFRITAAVSEPFADERIPKMLDGIADTVSLMFACAAASAAMFTVTVLMMISAGGVFAAL